MYVLPTFDTPGCRARLSHGGMRCVISGLGSLLNCTSALSVQAAVARECGAIAADYSALSRLIAVLAFAGYFVGGVPGAYFGCIPPKTPRNYRPGVPCGYPELLISLLGTGL